MSGNRTTTLLVALAVPALALAHGGEDHGEATPSRPVDPAGVIFVPKEVQLSLAIRTELTSEREVRDAISTLGKVVAPPWAAATIDAPVTARVVSVSGHSIPAMGDAVRKGQALAYLDVVAAGAERVGLVSERLKAEADLSKAGGALELARAELARLQGLKAIVAAKELQKAEIDVRAAEAEVGQARRALELLRSALGEGGHDPERLLPLPSPMDGVLAFSHAALGEQVEEGKVLFQVVDPSALWVEARVFESDLRRVSVGAPARVVLDAYSEDVLEGEVRSIGTVLEESTRTVPAVVVLHDPPVDRLKVGLFARLHLLSGDATHGVAVPVDAIASEEGGSVVIVKEGAETFRRVRVEPLGPSDGRYTIVRSGVPTGARVVTRGLSDVRAAGLVRR